MAGLSTNSGSNLLTGGVGGGAKVAMPLIVAVPVVRPFDDADDDPDEDESGAGNLKMLLFASELMDGVAIVCFVGCSSDFDPVAADDEAVDAAADAAEDGIFLEAVIVDGIVVLVVVGSNILRLVVLSPCKVSRSRSAPLPSDSITWPGIQGAACRIDEAVVIDGGAGSGNRLTVVVVVALMLADGLA